MEKAAALSLAQLRRCGKNGLKGCGVVYLGSEFCQNIAPSADDFRFVKNRLGKKAVLSTPLCAESRLEYFKSLIAELSRAGEPPEVVVNDLGLPNFLDEKYGKKIPLSLGRVLLLNILTVWRSLNAPYLAYLLCRYRPRRLEIDNPALLREPELRLNAEISFHYPLRFLAVTRWCPFAPGKMSSCGFACKDRFVKLKSPLLKAPLTIHNNAYFTGNRPCPHKLVTRLVRGL